VTTIEGEPYKIRIVVQQWESLDKIKAWHGSAAYQENRTIGNKFAKFRFIAVEWQPLRRAGGGNNCGQWQLSGPTTNKSSLKQVR
jgi:uncharacterized protein (DUF1330 family)